MIITFVLFTAVGLFDEVIHNVLCLHLSSRNKLIHVLPIKHPTAMHMVASHTPLQHHSTLLYHSHPQAHCIQAVQAAPAMPFEAGG